MSGLSDFLFPEAEAAPPGAGPNYNPANVGNAYQPGGLFTQYPFNGGQTAIPPSLGGTDFPLPGSAGAPVDVPSLGTETINPGTNPYDPANMAVGSARGSTRSELRGTPTLEAFRWVASACPKGLTRVG